MKWQTIKKKPIRRSQQRSQQIPQLSTSVLYLYCVAFSATITFHAAFHFPCTEQHSAAEYRKSESQKINQLENLRKFGWSCSRFSGNRFGLSDAEQATSQISLNFSVLHSTEITVQLQYITVLSENLRKLNSWKISENSGGAAGDQ